MSVDLETLQASMPVELATVDVSDRRHGLIIVDEVNGFATPGAGNLAPGEENAQVERMVTETDRLARAFTQTGWPVLAFLDTHEPGVPEPPYPPHCERGTGEEDLVPRLSWLEDAETAKLVRKDCINGFIGAFEGSELRDNAVIDWIQDHSLDTVIVVGICTDICVMDFVLTLLSARNHGMTGPLKDIIVYEPGCATYDLPRERAEAAGLPVSAIHPQMATHHMGLYFMGSRGAVLAGTLQGTPHA